MEQIKRSCGTCQHWSSNITKKRGSCLFNIEKPVPFFIENALMRDFITKYTDGQDCDAYIFDNPNMGN